MQLIPFNFEHALRAGELAALVYAHKEALHLQDRKIISNDTKMFAQADKEPDVQFFITSDVECIKIFNLLHKQHNLQFRIINIRTPYHETFGVLPF